MVKETSEYRCLQSQFSVLYNESLILKAQLDETRARLNTTRTARLRQLEHMEARVFCDYICGPCADRRCGPVLILDSYCSSLCRMTKSLCRGKSVQRCFSSKTPWLKSGKSMKC